MDLDTSDIDAQIAKLQQEKQRKLAIVQRAQQEQAKAEAKVLIGSTPTKKKPRLDDDDFDQLSSKPSQSKFTVPKPPRPAKQVLPSIPALPVKSSLSTSLAAMRKTASSSSTQVTKSIVPRSSTFGEKPRAQATNAEAGPSRHGSPELDVDEPGPQREADLTVLENLKLGPQEFGRDPEGEEDWLHLEPNSQIRLLKRVLPHAALQDHLYGRYYLPPSLIYSVIRLSKDGATYDIPVEGDWITIAVVAERSEIKISGAKDHFSDDDEDPEDQPTKQGDAPLSKEAAVRKKWVKRRGPRKYINMKLCALPPKTKSMGGEDVKGDAMLQLLLFESDATVHGLEGGEKKYRGGSGGAYEKWCNLTVGSVIAILNPRVLRPLRSGGQSPHPLTLPLALNPTSCDAITLIGQSRDLGCCTATQKDGKRCKTWVDMRVSPVCEYHIHAAIQRGRGGRAEFASATSSFALTTRPSFSGNGKNDKAGKYDPRHKTGLGPRGGAQAAPRALENGGGGATYVVGGQTVSTRDGFRGAGDEHLSEKLGRNRAGKRKRAVEAVETEKALSALLAKDTGVGGSSTGGKYLAILRKANGELDKKGKNGRGRNGAGEGEGLVEEDRKRPFSAGAIKRIGFDPTARRGTRDEAETAKRLDAISSLRDGNDRPLILSRPKNLSRSNVRAPLATTAVMSTGGHDNDNDGDEGDDMINLD